MCNATRSAKIAADVLSRASTARIERLAAQGKLPRDQEMFRGAEVAYER